MKMKMIVAALALAAAGSASANTSILTGGNGELFMTVIDSVGQKSYTLDTGLTMDTFLAGIAVANAEYNFAADANMTSFLSGVSNLSSLSFAIGAIDIQGVNRFVTSSTNLNVSTPKTNGEIKQFDDNVVTFIASSNAKVSVGNSVIATPADGPAYAAAATWGNDWAGKANFTTGTLIGEKNDMWLVYQASSVLGNANNPGVYEAIMQGGNQVYAQLDTDGSLTIAAAAPIPEADTYALMLAGLGLVGFLARRRKAA
jgi:hypothetical protein